MGFFMARKFKIGMICEAGFNTGTYYYTINTAEQLQKLGHDVTLITPMPILGLKVKQKVINPLRFKIPLIGRALWLITLYFKLYKEDFEVIESSWYGMMNLLPFDLYKGKLKVTTLFDVMADDKRFWKAHPDFFVVAKILQPPHLRFNDIVMTSSHYSKEQIIKVKGIPGEKIQVAYYGVSDEFGNRIDSKSLVKTKKKLHLPENFILNVGRIKMTKNITGIVNAFNMVAKKNPDIHLVFTGSLDTTIKAAEYHKLVHQEIQKMDEAVSKRIIFLNYVPEDDVKALYALATVFLMPSFEEGFGLPVIEAMRAGVPVVTSNISCMPEVAGGAALLCDPDNYKDVACKVEMILKDKALAQKLVSKGNVRAKYFTWEKTAKESIKIYEQGWKKKFGKLPGP
jgi:glycosyltransferase involved in cell wall biosynthesis